MRLPLYSLSDGKSAILHLNCAPQIIVIAIITTMYDLHKLLKDQTKNFGDFKSPVLTIINPKIILTSDKYFDR